MALGIAVVFLYAAGITCALVWERRRSRRTSLADVLHDKVTELTREAVATPEDAARRIELITEAAKVQQQEIPWYQRHISTAGLVAFLSMLVATGFQAVTSSVQSASVERLKSEIKDLESTRHDLEVVMGDASRTVLDDLRPLEASARGLLTYRLKMLEQVKAPSPSGLREQFQIAVRLQDYEAAIRLVEAHDELRQENSGEDKLLLAEYRFLSGTAAGARALLDSIGESWRSMPAPFRQRAIVLRATLNTIRQSDVVDFAAALRVPEGEAERRLTVAVDQLKRSPSKSRFDRERQ